MEVSGRRETGSKADGQNDIYCQPCHGEGDEVQAEGYCENCNEYFCSSCIRFHRKMSVTKNHVIKRKKDMPRDVIKHDPCVKPCNVHKTEIVKYYCSTHDSVGCSDCMVIGHKTCKVELVRDVSRNKGNSKEIDMIRQELEETMKQISSIKQEMKDNFKNAEDMKDKVKHEIRKFRKELNTYLDQAEEELLNEVDRLHSKDFNMQTDLTKECHLVETEIKQFHQEMHQYEENINQLFVTAKLAMDRFKTYQDTIKQISSNETCALKFDPSKELQALKVSKSPIGKLSAKTQQCVAKKSNSIVDMTAHFVEKLNVQAENEKVCSITGMAIISSDEILLADESNKSLKVLNVRGNTIISKYITQASPWDVTVINTDTCAATLPEAGKILFLKTKEGLTESHTWHVKLWCRGIDYHNGKIAVSYTPMSGAVEVLNMEGKVLYHTDLPTSIDYFPRYLAFCTDGTSIFVSDDRKNAVHQQIVGGKLKLNIYKNLNVPQGLAVTRSGTIVICESVKLTLLSPNTGEVQLLYDKHITHPQQVIINEETSTFYVCEANENSIKAFGMN